ncbi:PilW family protein [Psychrobacter sp. 1Y11]|uniref:PilW family protein n=1 Tax=Psychrobacter sp. 1Y11 TaxID=3457446 RepID=UPI003FD21563
MMLPNHRSKKTYEADSVIYAKSMQGFTLIELMIALILGLLISAAALQIFYTSSVNSRRQQASSQIQDNAIFGLSQVKRHLRRANFGARSTATNDKYFLNHQTPQGGVVLTAPNGSSGNWLENNLSGLVLDGSAVPVNLLSRNASSNSVSNIAGTANSDQLTIQYQVGQAGLFDCEGDSIPDKFYVIERYFVRLDTTTTPNVPALACASAIYDYNEALASSATGIDIASYEHPVDGNKNNNLAGSGTIIIPNVDYFRVKLGLADSRDFATFPDRANSAYISIPNASNLATAIGANRIVKLQIGILARSNAPTITEQDNSDLRFTVLDKSNVALNTVTADDQKFLRNVYEGTVLLRNARGGL